MKRRQTWKDWEREQLEKSVRLCIDHLCERVRTEESKWHELRRILEGLYELARWEFVENGSHI